MNQQKQIKFSHGLNTIAFVVQLLKYLLWTGIHLCILFVLRTFDNEGVWSDTWISVCMIPVGLANIALMVAAFGSFKAFYWRNLMYFLFVAGNFVMYVLMSMQMYSQVGSMTN